MKKLVTNYWISQWKYRVLFSNSECRGFLFLATAIKNSK